MKGLELAVPYEGASLKLVPPTLRHAPDSLRWVSDPDVCRFMGLDFSNVSLEGERKRLQEIIDTPDGVYWVIELDARPVGNASLHSIAEWTKRYSAKAGAYTIMIGDRAAQGRGAGTAVTHAVFDWAFTHDFEVVVARVAPQNAPSLGIMKKLGMQFTGSEPNTEGGSAEHKEWQVWELKRAEWLAL
jgi:RimJ/RimL family protein N-acetyltransferase